MRWKHVVFAMGVQKMSSITLDHSGVSYKLLRSRSNLAAWSYDAAVTGKMLKLLKTESSFVLGLGDDYEPKKVEIKQGNKCFLLRSDGWWARIDDVVGLAKPKPKKRGRGRPKGTSKKPPKTKKRAKTKTKSSGMIHRPVRLVANEKAWISSSDEEIKLFRDAFEIALWTDGWGKRPPAYPGMRHYVMDFQLLGNSVDIMYIMSLLFDSPDTIQGNWDRRSRTNASLGHDFIRVELNKNRKKLILGGGEGVQLILCKALEEVDTKPKWHRHLVRNNWWDAGGNDFSPILRLEVRIAQRWLRRQSLDGSNKPISQLTGVQFERAVKVVVKTILERNVFCPSLGFKKDRSMHPMWKFLCNSLEERK
jgi:hypothetical protein